MQVPGRPVPAVVLQGLQHLPHPLLARSVPRRPRDSLPNSLTITGSVLVAALHLGDPSLHGVALERIGMIGVDHAVALGIGELLALEEARHVVGPVQAARDHDVLRAPWRARHRAEPASRRPRKSSAGFRSSRLLGDLAAFEPESQLTSCGSLYRSKITAG